MVRAFCLQGVGVGVNQPGSDLTVGPGPPPNRSLGARFSLYDPALRYIHNETRGQV